MCGRARCTLDPGLVTRATGVPADRWIDPDRFRPSYNVSPGRYMPVLRSSSKGTSSPADEGESCKIEGQKIETEGKEVGKVVQCMKWGLVPSFTKKSEKPDHFRMFNARSESLHEKSSFRRLLPHSRCVAMVEGFYEWKKDEKSKAKQPYYVHWADQDRPMFFAALHDRWEDAEGQVMHTFTIVTTRVSKALTWLHDRMPVILPTAEAVDKWLSEDLSLEEIRKLAEPYEGKDLVWYPISPAMGRPTVDGPEVVKEVKPSTTKNSAIAQMFKKARGGASVVPTEEALFNVEEKKALTAAAFPDFKEEDEGPGRAKQKDEEMSKEQPSTSGQDESREKLGSINSGSESGDVDKRHGDNVTGHKRKGGNLEEPSPAKKVAKSPKGGVTGLGRGEGQALSSPQKDEKQKTLTSFFSKR